MKLVKPARGPARYDKLYIFESSLVVSKREILAVAKGLDLLFLSRLSTSLPNAAMEYNTSCSLYYGP